MTKNLFFFKKAQTQVKPRYGFNESSEYNSRAELVIVKPPCQSHELFQACGTHLHPLQMHGEGGH